MTFIKYLTWVVLFIVIMYGPIDEYYIIRFSTLILLPATTWYGGKWLWERLNISRNLDNILSKILASSVSVALLLGAYTLATSKTHIINTEYIRTRDGYEAVGDYIEKNGADYGGAITLLIIAILILRFAVFAKTELIKNES